MAEIAAIQPSAEQDRGRADFVNVPSKEEFFRRIKDREATLKALNENVGGLAQGQEYRDALISAINRQSPFERFLLSVWGRVQSVGWSTAERARLAAVFKTNDDWEIAFKVAQSEFRRVEKERVVKQIALPEIVSAFADEDLGGGGRLALGEGQHSWYVFARGAAGLRPLPVGAQRPDN